MKLNIKLINFLLCLASVKAGNVCKSSTLRAFSIEKYISRWDEIPEKDVLTWAKFQIAIINDNTKTANFEHRLHGLHRL